MLKRITSHRSPLEGSIVKSASPRLLVSCAAITAFVTACASLKVYKIRSIDVPNKAGKLANGLRVVINPEPDQAHVFVQLRYNVGAAHDPADKKGLAHLIEHLAFRLDDEIVEVPAAGAERGRAPSSRKAEDQAATSESLTVEYLATENAWTNFDETVYWKRVVPDHMDDVLAAFAEQMSDFSGQISQEVFDTEREVVRNERRQRYERHPLDRFWLDLYERFFPPGHPYHGHAVIGSHETLQAITRDDLGAFLRAHYHPANATLTIVGPVDVDRALARVMELFGGKPKREPSVLTVPPNWRPVEREVTLTVPGAKDALLTVAWPLDRELSEEALAMELLDDSIGGWFYYRLVSNRGWSYWVGSGVIEHELGSMYAVWTLLKDPSDVDTAKSKILEIAPLLQDAIDGSDIAMARRRMIYDSLYGADDAEDRAIDMARFFPHFGTPLGWMELFARLDGLDLDEVQAVGRKVLSPDRAFVLVLQPPSDQADSGTAEASYSKEASEKSSGGGLVREERDLLPKHYAFTQPFPAFRDWAAASSGRQESAAEITLSNGVPCRIIRAGQVPSMAVTALFRGGSIAEPRDRHGVGQVLFNTMGNSSPVDREKGYRIGVRSSFQSTSEWFTYTQRFPSFYADEALEMFVERLSSPRILRSNVQNTIENYSRDLRDAESDVDALASRAYWRAKGLQRVWPIATKDTLANIGLGDVNDFYDATVATENMLLTVSSDLPIEQVRDLLEKHVGSWSSRVDPMQSEPADATPKLDARLVTVEVPASTQTKILLGIEAPGWSDPDGSLRARAVSLLLDDAAERIRAAMGVTYGAHASYWSTRDHGVIRLTTSVQSDAVNEAVQQLLRVVRAVRDKPIDEGLLDRVRRGIIFDLALEGHEDASARAGDLARNMARGRPLDHRRRTVEALAGWTVGDLQEAVNRSLATPGTVVVAGKRLEIEAGEDEELRQLLEKRVEVGAKELL